MAIKSIPVKGLPPLDEPVAKLAIEDRLAVEKEKRGERALAGPTRLRCSDGYGCARKIAFATLGVPKDISYSPESLLQFRAGDLFHQITQEALVAWFDAGIEYPVNWLPEHSLSGHADSIYADEQGGVVVEIKSTAGFGFDIQVGNRKSAEGPGPKIETLIQAGLYALSPEGRSLNVNRLHVILINRDRCTVAEWVIGLDDPLSHLGSAFELGDDVDEDGKPVELREVVTVRSLVEAELARMDGILAELDAGALPAREVPGYGLVDDPPPKDSRDNPWQCRFCSWQPSCSLMTTGRIEGWVADFEKSKGGEAA